MGDSLVEVIHGSKPSNCQRTPMMVFWNKPPKKGLSDTVINRYRNLSEDNYSLGVVNRLLHKNIRQSILQGDKFARERFAFGMDPILGYLEACLQGILINSIPAAGPLI